MNRANTTAITALPIMMNIKGGNTAFRNKARRRTRLWNMSQPVRRASASVPVCSPQRINGTNDFGMPRTTDITWDIVRPLAAPSAKVNDNCRTYPLRTPSAANRSAWGKGV